MAKSETCQLFLEQEIKIGLSKGKTPDLISKELTEWIEEKLKVKIQPGTIKKRAQRVRQKNDQIGTNVPKITEPDSETTEEPPWPMCEECGKDKAAYARIVKNFPDALK